MDQDGYRRLQTRGEITLPKNFRQKHDLNQGDKILYKEHSRDCSKIILQVTSDTDNWESFFIE